MSVGMKQRGDYLLSREEVDLINLCKEDTAMLLRRAEKEGRRKDMHKYRRHLRNLNSELDAHYDSVRAFGK